MQGLSFRQRATVEFVEYRETAAARGDDCDIIDESNPATIAEARETPEQDDSEGAAALRRLNVMASEGMRATTNRRRRFEELLRRVIALGIRCGALHETYQEASEFLNCSRQNLHRIGEGVGQRVGLTARLHPGKQRAGKAGARAKHEKERPVI
jgi:hypothetical protein